MFRGPIRDGYTKPASELMAAGTFGAWTSNFKGSPRNHMSYSQGRPHWPAAYQPWGVVSAAPQSGDPRTTYAILCSGFVERTVEPGSVPPVYRPQRALPPTQPRISAVVSLPRKPGSPPAYRPALLPGLERRSAGPGGSVRSGGDHATVQSQGSASLQVHESSYAPLVNMRRALHAAAAPARSSFLRGPQGARGPNRSSGVAQPILAGALIGGVGLAAAYGLYRAYQWFRGPAPPPILCSEGQHVAAAPNQGVNFGGVTSCMTLTCVLADRSKVAGHLSQANYAGVIAGMQARIAGRTVTKVIAAGTFGAWTPNLEDQATFIQRHYRGQPPATDLQLLQDFERLRPFAVDHMLQFRVFLQGAFGCGTIRTVNFDEGSISVNAAGNDVQTNAAHNAV
jgi:hypothetical protein